MAIQDESLLPEPSEPVDGVKESTEGLLIERLEGGKWKKYTRFVMAALGCLPWVGSVISAAAEVKAGADQDKQNELQKLWLQEHRAKVGELMATFHDIISRLDGFGDEIQKRIESEEYLALVRRVFSSWDRADTLEKRLMLKRLITNAGAVNLCPDDLIRLFVNWIDQYHEAHFLVIRAVYKNIGITRGRIWDSLHPSRPREDSSEADLFRYLIRDLSTGGVIRQSRETNDDGEFMKRRTGAGRGSTPSRTMESAFEEMKSYELTELGKQFVHYVMEDVSIQIGESTQDTV